MNPRISARRGQTAGLDVDFYRGGTITDPFAIRTIDIYQEQVQPANLIETITVSGPDETAYPSPLTKSAAGKYQLAYQVPDDLVAPQVYLDVWNYFADDPCISGTGTGTACDLADPAFDSLLISSCHRFWIYPDAWFTDDRLQSITFGFEPLAIKFNVGDVRSLDIGLMPLPLYDFDYNLVAPMIPFLTATIRVETRYGEVLIESDAMTIGIRQGSYRTNPFVLRWTLNAAEFLIGTYRYRVTITLPNGTKQASSWMIFTIA